MARWPGKDARQRYPGRAPILSARLHHPLAVIKSKMRATVLTDCDTRVWPGISRRPEHGAPGTAPAEASE